MASLTDLNAQYDLTKFRQQLVQCFSDGELRSICFDLGIDYEALNGENKSDKARELLLHLHRRGRLSDLVVICTRERPNALWTKPTSGPSSKYEITVECSDITSFLCDVVILKHAQAFYGADEEVASRLTPRYEQEITLRPGEHALLPSRGKIAARQVLFLGVLPLYYFRYGEIREFASRALEILAAEMPSAKRVAMTIHGIGAGLDETEAFLAQVAGLLDAFRGGKVSPFLEQVIFVERNSGRSERLGQLLRDYLPLEALMKRTSVDSSDSLPRISTAGEQSDTKPHVFVAMPFTEDMEDTFVFGIQAPVNAADYLCERVDLTTFTGDILARIKARIETAALVIAELTGANPNVYLEVGYAWGKERPTLLIAKKGEQLRFDAQGQRCIMYKNITELAKRLESDLASLSRQM